MKSLHVIGYLSVLTALAIGVETAAAQPFDHMRCYRIKDEGRFVADAILTASDPLFGNEICEIQGGGKLYCVPVEKELLGFEDKSKIGLEPIDFPSSDDLLDDRVCYRVKCPVKGPIAPEVFTDQFGTRLAENFRTQYVCAPAGLGVPPETCGRFELKWGTAGQAVGQFNAPHGVAVDDDGGWVYVSDLGNNRIQKFTLTGAYETQWGTFGEDPGEFDGPHAVATASGIVAVADTGNDRIQTFTPTGTHLLTVGITGNANGEMLAPQGVAIDNVGNLYVADTENHRVQKFNPLGVFIVSWGSQGSAPGSFNFPFGIHVDATGSVYVADSGNHRIQKFTSGGAFVLEWGTQGTGNGQFFEPHDVATNAIGNIYVSDLENAREQVFDAIGVYVTQWGSSGSANGEFLVSPHALAATDDGEIFVVDSGNERIQRFACQ